MAEESLSGDKLTLHHVRHAAGSLAAHPARIILDEMAIKPKQQILVVGRQLRENQIFRGNRRYRNIL